MSIINYTDKTALNINPDVPDVNKVTADDMNNIKNAVNNNATQLNNLEDDFGYLSGYSTTERTIGYWIDGKPLYRSVFTGTKVSGTNLEISTGLTTVDKLVKLEGTIDTLSGYVDPINQYTSSSIYNVCNFNKSNGKIGVVSSTGNYSNGDVIIIMEYTKTTD